MESTAKCPNCETPNTITSMFCVECGFWLGDLQNTTQDHFDDEVGFRERLRELQKQDHTFPLQSDEYLLYFPDKKENLTFSQEQSIVLGRRTNSGVTGVHVVDLTPFDAVHLGVSRHHAQITYRNGDYFLADLESSNGTFINDERLHLGKQYLLKNGDFILLARLAMMFQCSIDDE